MKSLTEDEINRLLDKAEGDTKDILTVAVYAGLRQGELFGRVERH
ncbi:MAG: hypothetical protein PHP64_05265 [Actinomycetota bacterium]|nr:hypothetical protein [Actinomycetota bacterium]